MNYTKLDKSTVIKLLIDKRWVWHAMLWVVYILFEMPSYFFVKQPMDVGLIFIIQDILFFVMSYIIILVLFPYLYDKKKHFLFIFFFVINALLANLLGSYLTNNLINDYIVKNSNFPEVTFLETFFQSLTIFFLFSLFIVMSKIIKSFILKEYHANQRQKMQIISELNNLKAQLSPHFLFNTLNNFYGLAVDKSTKLPDLMLRLSDLMRYSLYETKNEKVSLQSEVDFLLNYIELEKIRLEDTLQLTFDYKKDDVLQFSIAPLLLIVFVENAFKHSRNSYNEPININIKLDINQSNEMSFFIENNYHEKNISEIVGGLGIDNVQKRLQVLYPDHKHDLHITKNANKYIVNLKLQLN